MDEAASRGHVTCLDELGVRKWTGRRALAGIPQRALPRRCLERVHESAAIKLDAVRAAPAATLPPHIWRPPQPTPPEAYRTPHPRLMENGK